MERPRFAFIVDVEYDKLLLFCSKGKMIGHDLLNYNWLQQDVNVIYGEDKTMAQKYNIIILK